MKNKTFTLDEANTLLPVLESLLKQAMDSKQLMEAVDHEFQQLAHKVFLNGGTLVDVSHFAKRKAEREKAVQQIKDSVSEIHSTGVQVKDLDMGLLDFPCNAAGDTVLLCWKYGEPKKIMHWHGLEEGFTGRKPIETLSFESKKRPNPDRPN